MKTLRTLVALVLLSALATACESDSDAGPSPFACKDGVSDFEPCGGSPEGDWVFDAACFDFASQWEGSEMKAACPEAKVSGTMTWVGSATFDDGQGTIRMQGGTAATRLEIPTTCLKGVACEGLVPEYTCATSGAACVCNQSSTLPPQEDSTMPYRVEGTDLVVTEEGGEARTPFCRKGDWAAIQLAIGPDTGEGAAVVPLILTLKRK